MSQRGSRSSSQRTPTVRTQRTTGTTVTPAASLTTLDTTPVSSQVNKWVKVWRAWAFEESSDTAVSQKMVAKRTARLLGQHYIRDLSMLIFCMGCTTHNQDADECHQERQRGCFARNTLGVRVTYRPTMRSSAQKMAKIMDGKSSAVAIVQRFHILPLKNLYMVADQYPAKDPISTNNTSRAVNMPPLIGRSAKPQASLASVDQSKVKRMVGRWAGGSVGRSVSRSVRCLLASFCF